MTWFYLFVCFLLCFAGASKCVVVVTHTLQWEILEVSED